MVVDSKVESDASSSSDDGDNPMMRMMVKKTKSQQKKRTKEQEAEAQKIQKIKDEKEASLAQFTGSVMMLRGKRMQNLQVSGRNPLMSGSLTQRLMIEDHMAQSQGRFYWQSKLKVVKLVGLPKTVRAVAIQSESLRRLVLFQSESVLQM